MSALKNDLHHTIPSLPQTHEPELQEKPRLHVITGGPRRKTIWFLVSYLIPVLVAVAIIMGINVSVSTNQYDVLQMKQEQTTLTHTNEALTQEIKNLQAPQNLAAQASQLGMVIPSAVGSIDVESKKVTGNPAPASTKDKPTTWVAKPGVASNADLEIMKPVTAAATNTTTETKESTAVLPEATLNGGTIPAPKQK